MGRKAFLLFFLFATATGGIAFPSQQKLSLDELTRQADTIVKGRVEDIRTQTSPDRSNMTTLVMIAVEDQWKGRKVSSVTVALAGGATGGIAQSVEGEPRFSKDERVIVFLKDRGQQYAVVGARQGKFAVTDDPAGKAEMVVDLTGNRQELKKFRAAVETAARP